MGVEHHEINLLVVMQFEQNQSLSCCGSSSTSAHSLNTFSSSDWMLHPLHFMQECFCAGPILSLENNRTNEPE